MALFTPTINSTEDWAAVFQDAAVFSPLVDAVFAREGFSRPMRIDNLTPGTNAVFRSGDAVVKLFAPEEAGLSTALDYQTETAMFAHTAARGVPVPRLLAAGEIADKYLFRYIIMAYVEGEEAGAVLPRYGHAEKQRFAERMREMLGALNVPSEGLPLRSIGGEHNVAVHGDLTGENILITPHGEPILIDLADACLAPACYELPPLVFELFRCDRTLVRAFLGGGSLDHFLAQLLHGLSLHRFSKNILHDFFARERLSPSSFPTPAALQAFLARRFA